MCLDDIKKSICALFKNSYIRLTPSNLQQILCRSRPEFSPRAVRSAIKDLVSEGALLFTHHFNISHLEMNVCRPLRVSPRIVLLPEGHTFIPDDEDTQVIRMLHGSAFGVGDHPTTRLALRAVDSVMKCTMAKRVTSAIRALDIGTGSGVLAMAAVKLGAEEVVAVDIDHLALHEARSNIRLNAMEQKIAVSGDPLEKLIGTQFDLILANLRPPTLKQILPLVEELSSNNCLWVLSGFRQEDLEAVVFLLPADKAVVLSQDAACGWAAMTIRYHHSTKNQVKINPNVV